MREIVGVVARMRFHAIDEMAPLPVIYCSIGAGATDEPCSFREIEMSTASLEKSIRDVLPR